MAEWSLSYVRAEDVDRYWDWLAPFLARAIDKAPSNLTPEDVRDWAREEQARIWIVAKGDSAFPTAAFAVRQWPDGTVEFLTFSGSRMSEWLPVLIGKFCAMAKRSGQRRLLMGGRPGWMRRLSSHGFVFLGSEHGRVVMEKVL